MSGSVAAFYDQLADAYHLIFADWREAVLRQGCTLDGLIRAAATPPCRTVLDCACGIGTQAIGLAMRGYTVHATDLSPTAVARAGREAGSFGVPLTTGVADLRALTTQVAGLFDVVLACDNALPHLLADDDLLLAVRQMAAKLRPGGLLMASIRDYDRLVLERPRALMPNVLDGPEGRRIIFQTWDWRADGRAYLLHHFILRETADSWETLHAATEYRALLRDELTAILREAGFTDVRWHFPADSGYFQPIATARRG